MDSIDLGPAARQLADLVTGVDDTQQAASTPCPAYQVADLLEHIGTMARAFTAAARKEPGPLTEQQPAGDAARLPPDWRTRIPRDLATGQPYQPDPAALAGDEVAFGPSRSAPDGAPALDQVLALAGRDPSWATVA